MGKSLGYFLPNIFVCVKALSNGLDGINIPRHKRPIEPTV